MEKRLAFGPLPRLRRHRPGLDQAELAASERALAQQLERVALLVAIEEEVMLVLEHVLSGDPIALADVREQQYALAQTRASLLDARATAVDLRTRLEALHRATLATRSETAATPPPKGGKVEPEDHSRRG